LHGLEVEVLQGTADGVVGVIAAVNDEVHVAADAAVESDGELARLRGIRVHGQGSAGGQDAQVRELPPVEGKVRELLLAHHGAHSWGGGHQRDFRGDRDLLTHRGELQREIQGSGSGHVHHHVLHHQRREAGKLGLHGVSAHGQRRETVAPVAGPVTVSLVRPVSF